MGGWRGCAADLAVASAIAWGLAAGGCGSGDGSGAGRSSRNLHALAREVDHYVANYGPWTADDIAVAKRHQLAIVDPGRGNLGRKEIADLQRGVDRGDPNDDVLVLCYVSIGEDLRTVSLTDDDVRSDVRFRGDGTGPRMDPRPPGSDGGPLDGIDVKGAPSNGGTGFASFYLDDKDVHNSGVGDGFPDRNPLFGGLFVNAGDPSWFDTVDGMRADGPDGRSGLRELLTSSYGRGLDCDGVFLDTVDTAAPNSYTSASDANQTEYEWTGPGFGKFIRHVHAKYPDKLVLQNRGVFFFDPRRPQYAFNARGAIDFLLFESYRLNSDGWEEWDPIQYPDNRYNVAPKLMAEADRPDGFRVLSLGYAAGPADQMSSGTLVGSSSLGMDSLLEDIRVTQDLAGFRHYLTDPKVKLVNDFVLKHASLDDNAPPSWSSTFNEHPNPPASEPAPRVGIQSAEGGGGQITVRWDVALDMHRVDYVLYASPQPFDFASDPRLTQAKRIVLEPKVPADYVTKGVGPGLYPYEATLSDFPRGQLQYLVIRAADDSPAANEDANTVVVTATP